MTAVAPREAAGRFATPEIRVDGRAKVTGTAQFLADRVPLDSLWMAVVRSPYPHARIRSISVDAALAMPGVHAVITGGDVAGRRFGRRLQDWPVLAWDRARFIGDRVAAVAADTPEQAAAAALAVDVDYEELPAVLSIDEAGAPDAPILHPDRKTYTYFGPHPPAVPHPNVQGVTIAFKGDEDIEAVLGGAARVFDHTFTTMRQHQGHLEPHGASVSIDADDVIHVVTTNKGPFSLRNQLAATFAIPAERIEVDSGAIGGDFGGKGTSLDEGICLALAQATGRPVSAVMSYADELQAANPRHASRIRLRSGVDATGRIIGTAAVFEFDGGAYAAGKPMPDLTPPGPLGFMAAYDVEHMHVVARAWYTNTVPGGHMRGPGEIQTAFAGESHVDMIARELGVNPLTFRRRHAARVGTADVAGRRMRGGTASELLDLVEQHVETRRTSGPTPRGIGRGISLTARHMEGGRMSVRAVAHRDGSIEIVTGIADQGGGAHTMMVRVAATTLDLPVERFRVTRTTTAEGDPDLGVSASRVTYIGSQAVVAALESMRAELVRCATEAGVDYAPEASWDELIAAAPDLPVEATGTFDSGPDHDSPQDFSLAAFAIEVDVDERTGVVRLTDAFLAADTGTIINPVAHRGQVEGGFAFGIGSALLEELGFEDGRVTTVHLGDYKLPTILDVPPLTTAFVHADGRGAFGAKMAGELAISGVAPAIANAIDDAVGARVTALPMSPERVLAALADRDVAEPAP